MSDMFNVANLVTKLGLAGLSAAAGYGVSKTLESKAEDGLGNTINSLKAKKMAGYAMGGIAFFVAVWWIGNKIAKNNEIKNNEIKK